jgi:hypothetical protein
VIDTWKKALLAERIRELGVICRTQFDHTAWRVWEELDFAAAMLKGERLVEAEFQCEKAERALLAERRRLLKRRTMYDLIEAWQLRIQVRLSLASSGRQVRGQPCLARGRSSERRSRHISIDALAAPAAELHHRNPA